MQRVAGAFVYGRDHKDIAMVMKLSQHLSSLIRPWSWKPLFTWLLKVFDGAHCREEGCQKSGGSEAEAIGIDVNCMGSESVCYAQFQLLKSVSGGSLFVNMPP